MLYQVIVNTDMLRYFYPFGRRSVNVTAIHVDINSTGCNGVYNYTRTCSIYIAGKINPEVIKHYHDVYR